MVAWSWVFPLASGVDLPVTPSGQRILVRPLVMCSLADEALLDEGIEIRVQPTVVNLFLVVLFKFAFEREAMGGPLVRRAHTRGLAGSL